MLLGCPGWIILSPHPNPGANVEGLHSFHLFSVMNGGSHCPKDQGEEGALASVFVFIKTYCVLATVLPFWSEEAVAQRSRGVVRRRGSGSQSPKARVQASILYSGVRVFSHTQ